MHLKLTGLASGGSLPPAALLFAFSLPFAAGLGMPGASVATSDGAGLVAFAGRPHLPRLLSSFGMTTYIYEMKMQMRQAKVCSVC